MEAFYEVNAAFPWFFPTLVFVLGAVVGSFLNVCIYRIPAERSVISPRSACACGRPIAWYDNIPILSWLALRGRARCCGQRFSIRYPAVELLTATLFLACWLQHAPDRALAGMVLTGMLVCASFIDLDHMIIPDRFSIGAAVVGVTLSFALPGLHGHTDDVYWLFNSVRAMIDAIIGVIVGSGVVLWIGLVAEKLLRKEAMGFGDVKLVGGIGAFFGWQGAIFSIFGGAVLGTIGFALVLLGHALSGRRRPDATEPAAEESESPVGFGRHTPFGPMLAAGGLLYFLWLEPYVDGYFAEVAAMLNQSF